MTKITGEEIYSLKIDDLIRLLLAEAQQMQVRERVDCELANELMKRLLLTAKRADAVHYLYSAKLLRTAAQAIEVQVKAASVSKESTQADAVLG